MVARALQMEGTCTVKSEPRPQLALILCLLMLSMTQGEHGIGMGKKDALNDELDVPTVNVMRDIKRALDPNWVMNPGKVFDE